MNIVLVEPKMPANTGNIIRLCANTNSKLHLVGPLGFDLEEKKLRRAGLDYREWAQVQTYSNWAEFSTNQVLIGCSTKASNYYYQHTYQLDQWLVFGSETHGIKPSIRENGNWQSWIKIPMQANSRSLNLANSVAIILYEALRQLEFQQLG